MKQLTSICILLCYLQVLYAQQTDTINSTDKNGLKQGYWIVLGSSKQNTCYKAEQKVEEGNYKNNRKNGLWVSYFCNGQIKNKAEFKEGKPNGMCTSFHSNGTISETGTFVLNKWVDQYTLYFETGKPQQIFTFNKNGKRDGLQKHYYQSGLLQAISQWDDTLSAYMEFDTTGKLVEASVNKKVVKEGVKLSDQENALYKLMMDIAIKENKSVTPIKERSKQKKIQNGNIQDINIDPKEIQKRN